MPIAWLIFTLQYTQREKWLTRRNLTVLFILSRNYPYNGLDQWYLSLDVEGYLAEYSLSPPVDAVTHSWWFWVHSTYSYALLFLAHSVYWTCSGNPRHYRKQAGILLLAALIPWVGNILFLSASNHSQRLTRRRLALL